MNLAVPLALLLPPVALVCVGIRALFRRPRLIQGEARPALILAAHPDDCVIQAGAYAIVARSAGHSVRVAYLTCGAAAPDLPRAKTRRQEAYAVWGTLAIPSEDVHFMDLPEHAPSAASSWADTDRDRARAWLCNLVLGMPNAGFVFLPAPGEIHVDHRGLRQLALEAWKLSGRSDLSFFEGPEYNDYLSLLQAPKKVMVTLAAAIPIVHRFVRGPRRQTWSGFAQGGPYWELPPNVARQEQRRNLLRGFASEDGELLVRLFGGFERYRPVKDANAGLQEEPPSGYVHLGGRYRGFSAILVLIVLAESAGLLAALGCSTALRWTQGAPWMQAIILGAMVGAAGLGSRRRVSLETTVLYWALAGGAIAAVAGIV
jgi:LmbE family N-acetylglucosaminyl deacetylase